jgi:heme exporter protein B
VGRRQYFALVAKDLLSEARRLQTLLSMVIFAVLAMIVLRYGFGGGSQTQVPAAMLWVVFVFAALLGFGRTFAQEREDDCLDGLLLCPVDRVVLFFAKASANFVFLLVVQVIVTPAFAIFFSVPAGRLSGFIPVVLLADVGMAVLGTLLATLVLHARSRDLLLPIVLLPLLVPLIIAAASATTELVDHGASLGGVAGTLGFLAAYDFVFLVAAWGTYDFLVSE